MVLGEKQEPWRMDMFHLKILENSFVRLKKLIENEFNMYQEVAD